MKMAGTRAVTEEVLEETITEVLAEVTGTVATEAVDSEADMAEVLEVDTEAGMAVVSEVDMEDLAAVTVAVVATEAAVTVVVAAAMVGIRARLNEVIEVMKQNQMDSCYTAVVIPSNSGIHVLCVTSCCIYVSFFCLTLLIIRVVSRLAVTYPPGMWPNLFTSLITLLFLVLLLLYSFLLIMYSSHK
jgi:hypothetical protein